MKTYLTCHEGCKDENYSKAVVHDVRGVVYLGRWFVPLWLWLSKSGFSAGEIGWSYACTAIAAILSPIFVGSLTDRFFSAQKSRRC